MADGTDRKLATIPTDFQRPAQACGNCFATWRATRPRPLAFHCWHLQVVVRRTPTGWKTLENPSERNLRELRAAGVL